jgi:hypothetical protein
VLKTATVDVGLANVEVIVVEAFGRGVIIELLVCCKVGVSGSVTVDVGLANVEVIVVKAFGDGAIIELLECCKVGVSSSRISVSVD